MGGSSGGGPRRIGDVRALVEKAKEGLRGKKNVFISFAHENLDEVNLLRGQAKTENTPIDFNDWSVSDPYDSERAAYIKQRITERISQSSVTVVYITKESAGSPWVAWEIEKSVELGKRVVGVYKGLTAPGVSFAALERHRIKSVPWSQLSAELDK